MNTVQQSKKMKLLFLGIAGIAIAGILQTRYVFHIFFLEQFQLFLAGKEYALELLSSSGGFIEYLSEYCIQFFKINYVGSIFISILLLLIGVTIHYLLNNYNKKNNFFFIFEGLIILFLLINILDINFYLKGIIGYLFCVCSLLIYQKAQRHTSFIKRFTIGFSLAIILFWLSAPFQTLFLIAASCMDFKEFGFNKGKSLLFLILAMLSAFLINSYFGNSYFRTYISPEGICSLRIIPGWTKYTAWVLLPVALLFTPVLERLEKLIRKKYLTIVLQGLLITAGLVFLLPKYDDSWSLPIKRLYHYAIYEKWDEALNYCKKYPSENYICLNYQNLALADKGILADSLLVYPQRGKYGLFAPWDRTEHTAFVLQKISYMYGDIAFSQRYAFEGNVSSATKGFPETMKTLIRTNILQKEYQVAAKYIYYLQQTVTYKKWADKQYLYLSNPGAIESDPEYKGKQKYLQEENHFVLSNEIFTLADLDIKNRKLNDFVLCYFLLDKNLQSFLNWFDSYYTNMKTDGIPTIYYEAVMACAPNVPEVLNRYEIPDKIKENFELYASIYSSTNDREERKKWLSLNHINTYWFYFHYAQTEFE